ncbi:hypothetical protein [Vibrio cholerae]|uniref:hypothetical protein n=2 Tax=root TaxID=1 RepID=UPI0004E5D5FB|nr:hypothetical protein [Vibrio cholerae]YP_009056235.1 hypothetical protein LD36_gp23 [Vibrio phage ICP2_2013_A_Haiti]AII27137.1 hypothetical protein ICP22013AHaiti_23 [Vibrio phage ICP2_2013_A_Haiti]
MPIGVNVSGTNKQATMKVNVSGVWKYPIGWVREGGQWRKFQNPEYTYTISQNTANFNLATAVGSREEVIINLVINPGVSVYSTSVNTPAIVIPDSFAGKTINIINNGNIYGQGGVGGTGVGQAGGPALRVQTSQKINLTNNGTIAGGGGGGGKGGTGGNGFFTTQSTQRDPASGTWSYATGNHIEFRSRNCILRMGGGEIYRWYGPDFSTVVTYGITITVGEWTYYASNFYNDGVGVLKSNAMYRTRAVTNTTYTTGGAGGNGGNGQGFSQAATNGLAGANGGTNAGRGGNGGTGGTFGVAGNAGASGANGNQTAGLAGQAGGAAGAAVDGTSKVNYVNAGKLLGPLIN